VTYDKKVLKEILEVGEGKKKPKMNYLVKILYRAYFFDHEQFDSSNDEIIELSLGDISWPEGLWKGILEMRKNECSKIKIKKKYGFGRKEQVDKLKFPPGYEEEGEKRKRLMSKGIIYEVTLIDWVERHDILADGNFLKIYKQKADKKEW
jgi:FKBP-type peptidyl-prolyl cis-trans isomerase 2